MADYVMVKPGLKSVNVYTDNMITIVFKANVTPNAVYPFKVMHELYTRKGDFISNWAGDLFKKEEFVYITRERYIAEILKIENERGLYFGTINKGRTDFFNDICDSFIESAYITKNTDTISHEWFRSINNAVVNSVPHNISWEFDVIKRVYRINIECERPGLFYGKNGEIYNYYKDRIQSILDIWCKENNIENGYTFEFGITERHVLTPKTNTTISF